MNKIGKLRMRLLQMNICMGESDIGIYLVVATNVACNFDVSEHV